MNAVHPEITYHAVKVEQDQRLARLEHRRAELEHAAVGEPTTQRVRPTLPRRVAVATASAILMLSLIAGAAFAALQAPAGGAPGGGNAPGGGGGGGGVNLLR